MKQSTKKAILIGVVVFLVLIIGSAVMVRVTVDHMLFEVTKTISESGLLKTGNDNEDGSQDGIILPGLDPNDIGNGLMVRLDAEMVKQLENKVSTTDKLSVLSLLAKALPQKEYTRLLSFVADGVTQEELSTAIQILRDNLTAEDKRQIKQYYAKYLPYLEG